MGRTELRPVSGEGGAAERGWARREAWRRQCGERASETGKRQRRPAGEWYWQRGKFCCEWRLADFWVIRLLDEAGEGMPTPGVFAKSAESDEGKRVGARSCFWKSGRVRKRMKIKRDEVASGE